MVRILPFSLARSVRPSFSGVPATVAGRTLQKLLKRGAAVMFKRLERCAIRENLADVFRHSKKHAPTHVSSYACDNKKNAPDDSGAQCFQGQYYCAGFGFGAVTHLKLIFKSSPTVMPNAVSFGMP